MLLVCAGPDGFQALRKAQELERAYREKYDPSGFSVEQVAGPKLLEAIAERLGTQGLFSQRRCLRVQGLVGSLKKTDWDRAAKLFARDPEQSIVISLEDEVAPDAERAILGWDRSKVYRHAVKAGADFDRLASCLAQENGVEYGKELQAFAASVEGDGWAFLNALPRWKATRTLPDVAAAERSIFLKSDEFFLGAPSEHWLAFEDDEDPLPVFAQQGRQALRIFSGQADPRTPMFAKRKWERLPDGRQTMVAERFRSVLSATVMQRLGAMQTGELPLGMDGTA